MRVISLILADKEVARVEEGGLTRLWRQKGDLPPTISASKGLL